MIDRIAVMPIVTTRTDVVGWTRLNESIALIRVSEPPYMFSAVTETRPSADRISTIAPKPLNTLFAGRVDRSRSSSKSLPAHAASSAPRIIIQAPPSAEPQYVQ